jgi:hypothetical protein
MTTRQSISRHGLTALKARVKVRGLTAIDRRTAAAQALLAWRKELLADLGVRDRTSELTHPWRPLSETIRRWFDLVPHALAPCAPRLWRWRR